MQIYCLSLIYHKHTYILEYLQGLAGGNTHQVRGLFSTTEAIIQGNSLFANLGAALTLGAKHRLEFYYKMPNSSTHTGNYLTRSISDMAAFAYQYTF